MRLKLGNSEVIKTSSGYALLIKLRREISFISNYGKDVNDFVLKESNFIGEMESVRYRIKENWTNNFSKMSNM